jgi:hypothetical protein
MEHKEKLSCSGLDSSFSSGNKRCRSPDQADQTNKRMHLDDDEIHVRCYLNVTSAMHAKDGFVCVAIQTSCHRLRNVVKQVQNIYVQPQHLYLVRDDDEEAQNAWQRALPYIVVV